MRVVYDMAGFIVIIASIVIGFSLIFLTFNRNSAEPAEYPVHLYGTYLMLYGNFDDGDYSFSQKLLLSLILFALNVVLLNLLISIMGDSYGSVQEERILIDSKTRLHMIMEVVFLKKMIARKASAGKGYLIYCEPDKVEEEDQQSLEWNDRIDSIKVLLKVSEQALSQTSQNVNQIKDEVGKVTKKIEGSEKERVEMKKTSENTEKKMEAFEKKMETLEKKMDVLEKTISQNHEDLLKTIKAFHSTD